VLVTFATIGSRPIQSSAGKETSVPPPATALIIPATNAERRMTRVSRGTRATLSHVRGSATPRSTACRGASGRAKQASQREEGYPESSVSRREDRCAPQGSRRDGRGRGVVGRRAHLGGLGRPARCIRVLRRRYGRLHARGASPGSRDFGRRREGHPCVDGGVCSSGGTRLSRASADELGSRGERRL